MFTGNVAGWQVRWGVVYGVNATLHEALEGQPCTARAARAKGRVPQRPSKSKKEAMHAMAVVCSRQSLDSSADRRAAHGMHQALGWVPWCPACI